MRHTTMQLAEPRFRLRWRLTSSCVRCQEAADRQEGLVIEVLRLGKSMEEDHREVDPWRRRWQLSTRN
jgi:hypothetical protein